MTDVNASDSRGFLSVTYHLSRYAGLASSFLVTGIAILPIKFVECITDMIRHCSGAKPLNKKYELSIFDMPYVFKHEKCKKHTLAHTSYYGKFPAGIVAEVVGNAVGAVTAGLTFLCVGILETALTIAAGAIFAGILIIVSLLAALVGLIRSFKVGPEQAYHESMNYVASFL